MSFKYVLAGVMLVAFSGTALADFYIVQNKSDKKCTVLEQKPTDTKSMVVLGSKTYKTKADAEKDLTVVCK
jgi:hypothetical protein